MNTSLENNYLNLALIISNIVVEQISRPNMSLTFRLLWLKKMGGLHDKQIP